MKHLYVPVSLALLLQAGAQAGIYSQTVNTLIPDCDPHGLTSTLQVNNESAITSITVTLNISGGANGDLYAYLSYNGSKAVLLNRVGKTAANPFGYSDAGFTLTLSDLAAADVHTYGGNNGAALTGTWQPDGRDVNPQLVTDGDLRPAMFSTFNGANPNGTWTLFFADEASQNQSMLNSWSLQINAVPEPVNTALLAFGGLAALGVVWRHRSRKQPRGK